MGWWEADALSFPVRSFWRNLLLFPPGHIPTIPPLPPQLSIGHMPRNEVVLLTQTFGGVVVGRRLEMLDTKLSQPSKAEKWVKTPEWVLTSEEGWQGHTISRFAEQLVGS